MAITQSMLNLLNDSLPAQKTPKEMVAEALEKIEMLRVLLMGMKGGNSSSADYKKARDLGEDIAFLTKSLTIH
jgi:hypothetical protein